MQAISNEDLPYMQNVARDVRSMLVQVSLRLRLEDSRGYFFISILLVSCFMWSGALDSI